MAQTIDSQHKLTRRNFLALTGLAAAGVVATACGGGDALPGQTPIAPSPQTAATTGAPPAATTGVSPATTTAAQPTAAFQPRRAGTAATKAYQEAPQLAQLVKDGKLPPVAERLPKEPLVLKPLEQVGKYGGTWRAGLLGGADNLWLARTIGYEHLARWDPEWKQILPNVAASVEASPDAKSYTFKLREGIRWSDGQPFTADDIMFWHDDVFNVKELTSSKGVNPPTVTKVDQFTVRFAFAEPNGLFLQDLAASGGNIYTRYPKHYLQQFHQKYNTTNLDQLAQQNNAKDWVELFRLKGGAIPGTPYDAVWQNKDLPTLHPWRIVEPYGAVTRVAAERNPYYFKVDSKGDQLPYLDRVTYDVAQDAQTLVLKALNGEIDMQDRHIATNQNKAVFADNQQKGNYKFFETVPSQMNTLIIHLNLTHKDPAWRQLFQNKDFRIGLSHAINRQEIIDIVYVGQGEPWQGAPQRETAFFNERLAKQYTEFDLGKANAALDKVAPQKGGDGIRLRSDGKSISFTVEVNAASPDQADAMNLIKPMWQKVGVDIQVKTEDRSLLYTRKDANEHDAVVWLGGGGLDAIQDPRSYFPVSSESNYAEAWYVWFQKPNNPRAAPEEPPAPTKQQMDLYRQIEATADLNKQNDLMKQILAISVDQFYVIGVSSLANGYGIVKNNLKNVPAKMFSTGGQWPNPAPTNTCLYFYQ